MFRLLFVSVLLHSGLLAHAEVQAALTVLHRFGTYSNPSPLIEGRDGAMYGWNHHTIFRVTPAGAYRVVYRFDGSDSDGVSSLVAARDGYFYGTTTGPGYMWSSGVFFRLSYAGQLTILYRFPIGWDSPTYPRDLVETPDGTLFCTATAPRGGGSILKMTPAGEVTTFAELAPGNHGTYLRSLSMGHDGALWGTAAGSVFRVTMDRQVTNPITSGTLPAAPGSLVPHPDGSYYFLTSVPGWSGALMRLTPGGALTEVRRFSYAEIRNSLQQLTVGRDGLLYSGSDRGGRYDQGRVLRLSTAGEMTILRDDLRGILAGPASGWSASHDGTLYTMTMGAANLGAILRLRVPAQPRVNLPPLVREDVAKMPRPGESVTVRVLANDLDVNRDPLAITAVEAPRFGTATLDASGCAIVYTAPPGEPIVADEFHYTIDDGHGGTAWGHAVIRNPLRGAFHTLITDDDPRQDGALGITLTPGGALTGRLTLGGFNWAIRGALNLDNEFQTKLVNENGHEVQLTLALEVTGGRPQLRAELLFLGTEHSATLTLAAGAARVAGFYTVQLPASPAWGNQPATVLLSNAYHPFPNPVRSAQGDGFATMRVTAAGAVRCAGKTPDGAPFVAGNHLDATGSLPFFAELYVDRSGSPPPMRGWISGRIHFRDRAQLSDADGTLRWRLPFRGFGYYVTPLNDVPVSFVASRYIRPATGALPLPDASPAFDTTAGFNTTVAFQPSGEFRSNSGTGLVTGNIAPATGLLRGVVRAPGRAAAVFSGAILQKQQRAFGLYFPVHGRLGTTGIELSPTP